MVEPTLTDQGWRFGDYPGSSHDAVNGSTYLHELYTRADPAISGRARCPSCGTKSAAPSSTMSRLIFSG
ncbi:glutathione S-transferase [Nitrobacter sp. Nb-311A]|nr:glutathione S-transferase [Nitrobacter sp. Nb-311A]